jgi:hypothetical protein
MADEPMMSKFLAALPKTIPHRGEEFGEWLDEFQSQSDRACAVLAGAFLESLLEDLLTAFFVKHEKVGEFLGDGRLWTFSVRTDLAFALGLISEGEHRELNLIRKIRNSFAHDLVGTDFNRSDIKSRCLELLVPGAAGFEIPKDAVLPIKLRFCTAAVFLACLMRDRVAKIERRSELQPETGQASPGPAGGCVD